MAQATTLYSEAVDGDLDPTAAPTVQLVEGVNTITGTLPGTPPTDFDAIFFQQGAGIVVDAISLTFGPGWNTAQVNSVTTALFQPAVNLFDDNFNTVPNTSAPPTITASFQDTFGPETGPLARDVEGMIWRFELVGDVVFPSADWTLTINTTFTPPAPIPVPAGFPLLVAGIGSLALLRRRKT